MTPNQDTTTQGSATQHGTDAQSAFSDPERLPSLPSFLANLTNEQLYSLLSTPDQGIADGTIKMMKSLRETIERYQEMLPSVEEMYKEGKLNQEQYDVAKETMTSLQMSFSQLMREEYKRTTLETWPIIRGTVRFRKRRYDNATVRAPLFCIQFLASLQNAKGPMISGTPLNEIDTQRPRTLGDWLWTDIKDIKTHKLWAARRNLFGSLSDDAVPSKIALLRQRIKANESCIGAWERYDVQRKAFWKKLESKQVEEPAPMGIIPEVYETGDPNRDSESDYVKSDAEESQSESEAD